MFLNTILFYKLNLSSLLSRADILMYILRAGHRIWNSAAAVAPNLRQFLYTKDRFGFCERLQPLCPSQACAARQPLKSAARRYSKQYYCFGFFQTSINKYLCIYRYICTFVWLFRIFHAHISHSFNVQTEFFDYFL